MTAQKLHIAHLNRPRPANRAHNAGYFGRLAISARHDARRVEIDPFERIGETVEITLPLDLAIGDDIQSSALLIMQGRQGRIVLSLLQKRARDTPNLFHPHSRRTKK